MSRPTTFRVLSLCASVVLLSASHCKPKDDASKEKDSEKSGEKSASKKDVTKADSPDWSKEARAWVDAMREAMPKAMCEDKQFFRQCFSVDEAECKSRFANLMEVCLKQHPGSVPKVVNAETGAAGGQTLGTCMGSTYELDLKKEGKRTDSAKCNDISNWVPK